MANKFKKIDKEYLLTDSSLNSYSYRLLTSGYLIDEFKKNPIGYKMHLRDEGVLVRWEDFRKEDDKVYAKPVVNLSHPKGQQVVDEIENGFLNAASVGHIVALEISTDPKDYLPNQKGPTISKWFNRECSLVDIPGNYNALSDLFDEHENPLNLADFTKPQKEKMKQVFLTPEQISKLNLKAEPTQQDVETALDNLAAQAAKVPDLTARLTAAETAKKKAEDDLAALKTQTTQKEVDAILDQALNVDKKITADLKATLATQFAGKPVELKDLIDKLPAYTPVTTQLTTAAKADNLADKSWAELDKAGKLQDLKAANADLFFEKYQAHFGKPHPDKK